MVFDKIKNEVKVLLNDARGSHDWEHTERVYRLCMHIGKIEKADMKILQLAVLLHDIGRKYECESLGKICHAEKGSSLSRELLQKYNLNLNEIDRICHCIETHRCRGDKVPLSKEAKILFDSDKLDAIGAVGVGRAFLFAGEIGSKLHNKEVDLDKTEAYTKEDTAYREFVLKLIKIKDRMLTEEGKRLAQERHDFMVEFFNRLNKEVDGQI